MKTLLWIGLILLLNGSCDKKDVAIKYNIATMQLNFGEEKQFSYTNSSGSTISFTIKFINAVENRCRPTPCSVADVLQPGAGCLSASRSLQTYSLVINSNRTDTLKLILLGCMSSEDLKMDDSLIDKKVLAGATIGLSNATELTDTSKVVIKNYFVKYLIQTQQ